MTGLRILAAERYVSPASRPLTPTEAHVRATAIALKERDPGAVAEAVARMAPFVPPGALLVPVPSSTVGSLGGNAVLAAALGRATGAPVGELVRRARPIEGQRARRHAGRTGAPEREQAATMKAQRPPLGARVVLVDNVVVTGATMLGAWAALGSPRGAIGLAYAGGEEVLHRRANPRPPRRRNTDSRLRELERAAAGGDTQAQERLKAERQRAGQVRHELRPWHQPVEIPERWLMEIGPHQSSPMDTGVIESRDTPGDPPIEAAIFQGEDHTYVVIVSDPDGEENPVGWGFDSSDLYDGAVLTMTDGHGAFSSTPSTWRPGLRGRTVRVRLVDDRSANPPGARRTNPDDRLRLLARAAGSGDRLLADRLHRELVRAGRAPNFSVKAMELLDGIGLGQSPPGAPLWFGSMSQRDWRGDPDDYTSPEGGEASLRAELGGRFLVLTHQENQLWPHTTANLIEDVPKEILGQATLGWTAAYVYDLLLEEPVEYRHCAEARSEVGGEHRTCGQFRYDRDARRYVESSHHGWRGGPVRA